MILLHLLVGYERYEMRETKREGGKGGNTLLGGLLFLGGVLLHHLGDVLGLLAGIERGVEVLIPQTTKKII